MPGEDDPLEVPLARKTAEEHGSVSRRCSNGCKSAYLLESREDKIRRYRAKKLRRQWSRKISYNCRKLVADSRERKNGRFVRKEQGQGSSSKKSSRETGDAEAGREGEERGDEPGIEEYCC